MTINDQIRDQKLQYSIKREAAKISALSLNKIAKYEYFTGEEINLFIPQLEKAFEKQIKTIENQRKKQVEALKRFKTRRTSERLRKCWN